MLAALLHTGPADAAVRVVQHQRVHHEFLPVAGVLQLDAQSGHIHDFQSGVPAGVQEDAVRGAGEEQYDLSRCQNEIRITMNLEKCRYNK